MSARNPAKRLLTLIRRAEAVAANNKKYGDAWRVVLEATKESDAAFLSRYAKVLELPNDARRTFAEVFRSENEAYLAWVPKLTGAFQVVAMQSEWRAFRSQFDAIAEKELEFCAHRLEESIPDDFEVDADTVRNLETELEKLRASAERADVPEDLRSFVLDRIDEIHAALILFRLGVVGAREVVRAVEAASGACSDEQREELERHEWGRRFLALFKWTAKAAAAGLIGNAVVGLLKGG